MTRLTRQESQAITRTRLLEAATALFRTGGYATTTIDAIAERAGYSKGAFYSNFDSKEAIFLVVLDAQGQDGFDALLEAVAAGPDWGAVIDLLARWADRRSRSGGWSLAILEHARLANGASRLAQEDIIRSHWRQLGAAVLDRLASPPTDAETLGALLHEIAYAPALSVIDRPTAGTLMRLALAGLAPDR